MPNPLFESLKHTISEQMAEISRLNDCLESKDREILEIQRENILLADQLYLYVTYILNKYADMARQITPSLIPESISCHSLRYPNFFNIRTIISKSLYIKQ